jgi:glucokinase
MFLKNDRYITYRKKLIDVLLFRTSDAGWNKALMALRGRKMKALAIDLGGTHANCALVEDRKILCARVLPIHGTSRLESVLPALADTLRGLAACGRGASSQPVAGIALGFCGLVNTAEKRIASTNAKYEDAPNVDLPAWASEELGLPIWLENDARMALLGEWYAGAASGFDDVVMVTLGTGIGGAAMIGGRLLSGKHFQAGCLGGHFIVRPNGRLCTCGANGCAEAEASGWSLPAICREWPGFAESALADLVLDFETLFRCADAGDSVAVAVRDHCLDVWAANAVSLIHAYDPEVLVYGGGVLRSGSLVPDAIRQHITQRAWTPWGKVQVRAAMLDNNAALLGAVPLIAEATRSKFDVR